MTCLASMQIGCKRSNLQHLARFSAFISTLAATVESFPTSSKSACVKAESSMPGVSALLRYSVPLPMASQYFFTHSSVKPSMSYRTPLTWHGSGKPFGLEDLDLDDGVLEETRPPHSLEDGRLVKHEDILRLSSRRYAESVEPAEGGDAPTRRTRFRRRLQDLHSHRKSEEERPGEFHVQCARQLG